MIDISKLSKHYSVRILKELDVDMLVELCRQNTVFYEYTGGTSNQRKHS